MYSEISEVKIIRSLGAGAMVKVALSLNKANTSDARKRRSIVALLIAVGDFRHQVNQMSKH